MGFLKRIFGGKEKQYVDKQGIYFYVQCDNCGSKVRVRADKVNDFNRKNGGFVWHKTIIDNRCFRRMGTVVHLDNNYRVTEHEIQGGRYITKEKFDAPNTANVSQPTDENEG